MAQNHFNSWKYTEHNQRTKVNITKYLTCHEILFINSSSAGSVVPYLLLFMSLTYFLMNGAKSAGSVFRRSGGSVSTLTIVPTTNTMIIPIKVQYIKETRYNTKTSSSETSFLESTQTQHRRLIFLSRVNHSFIAMFTLSCDHLTSCQITLREQNEKSVNPVISSRSSSRIREVFLSYPLNAYI